MIQNIGTFDRAARVLLAIVVLVLFLRGTIDGMTALALGLFAVVFVATSLIGHCPLYRPFKISTRKQQA